MSELYRAIAGSPITYLAADISANQTTISIVDDSALPDAPNICTIGYGENIETIRYGAKSNGVLQNVTRGLEGTPRAWKAGTEVARFYTAYEHNAIVEAIDGLTVQNINSSFTRLVGTGGNTRFRYIPALNMVWLTWNITGANITPGENRIAKVDSKYAPPSTVYSMLIAADSKTAQVHILSNGDIMAYSPESLSTIRGTVTWFLE